MRRSLLTALLTLGVASAAQAAAPPRLSADTSRPSVASAFGSGAFGAWGVDDRGLPRYRYSVDELTSAFTPQAELNGRRDGWHQVGNDHVVAMSYNHGYTALWSQDHLAQWADYVDEPNRHYGGGFGWLVVGGKAHPSLYVDRAPGAATERDFGVGYARHEQTLGGVEVTDHVYSPFGDDPLLLHDVVLHNPGSAPVDASWIEYWDVNPYFPGTHSNRGTAAPTWDPAGATLSTTLLPTHPQDLDPLTVFTAAVAGPVDGFETDADAFFGSGTRALPQEVAADKLGGALGGQAADGNLAHMLQALRAPVRIPAGGSVTLRYAYGMAKAAAIPGLVAKYRAAPDPLAASQQAWVDWLPRSSFAGHDPWLSRELQWDAYMVRSGATYEECAGRHVISQGGYYQYDLDFQGAYRDPLQHMLPMIYSDPALARDVIAYSAAEQPTGGGQIPYARLSGCKRFDLGTSDDLDLWLLLSAAEYGLATRDVKFFDEPIPWEEGGSATLWEHLRAAYKWQETQRGPHGVYVSGSFGDWSDISTPLEQMTESTLVATQTAYVYPRLAELADLRGDTAFAKELRATAAGLKDVVGREWTGKGWYGRGYSGARQMGSGVIYGEPQPWAMLAGVPSPAQATTLVANIRRFLTGIGAPGGPARIGSSQSPAANDPDVTETSVGGKAGVGDNHAVFVGGQWFAVDGWLTWALGTLDGIVPKAREYAFDEFERNTLAVRATVYPEHWNGIISVDDTCRSWYSTDPSRCGFGLSTAYSTQIMHQPAWSLFDMVKLAGVEPVADGYRVVPHLPMDTFDLRLPGVGVAATPRTLRGYVRPEGSSSVLTMRVAVPPGAGDRTLVAYANGRRVASHLEDGLIVFPLFAAAGQKADWAVSAEDAPRACTSRRRFVIRLPRGHVRQATVTVAGRRVAVRRRGQRLVATVDLRRQARGTVRVVITETLTDGRSFTTRRTYRTCTRRA